IAGCRAWCAYPEINDIGLTAVSHPATGVIGFAVRVGGGLSTDPHLGVRLDAFVPWGQALDVVRAIAEIFRDSDVLRQNREKARLKFLFLQHGWTAERFHALARDLETAGCALDASPFRRGTVACTGSEFCKLALTETKGFARGLVETLERRLPGFDQHLRINITGCPNSCGQHWIADL